MTNQSHPGCGLLSGAGLNVGDLSLPRKIQIPALPEAETMASKPEKRVASSIFINLVPPRRDEAVVEEVR